MSTLKVSTISPLGTDATKTITIGSASNGDVAAGVFTNTPAFLAEGNGSNQSISSGSFTKASTGLTISIDTDSAYSSSTFTVPANKGGKYFFFGCMTWQANATGQRMCSIYKNGSEALRLITQDGSSGTNSIGGAGGIVNCSASDTIEFYVYQNSGGSLNLQSDTSRLRFGGYRIIGV